MKTRRTKKSISASYEKIICVGYCWVQCLLSCCAPVAYTCGVYGWNADIYEFGDVAICTGHRAFGNIEPEYELVKAFEDKAEEISNNYYGDFVGMRAALNELVYEFIGSVGC